MSAWVVRSKLNARTAPRHRVLALAHAGAGASPLLGLAEHFPEDIELVPLRLPGRESLVRERPISDAAELVTRLADVVEAFTGEPYSLYGHCFGGLAMLAVSTELAYRGVPAPSAVFLSSQLPPRHLENLRNKLSLLPPDEFWMRAVRLGGFPESLLDDRDFRATVWPALIADWRVMDELTTTMVVTQDTPIIALRGVADEVITAEAFQSWSLASHRVSLVAVDGDHWLLQKSPRPVVEAILDRIG